VSGAEALQKGHSLGSVMAPSTSPALFDRPKGACACTSHRQCHPPTVPLDTSIEPPLCSNLNLLLSGCSP